MKRKLVVLLCATVLAGVLSACGNTSEVKDDKNTTDVATEEVTTDEAEVAEEVQDTTDEVEVDASVAQDVVDSIYVGDWHEKTAGRGSMNVTSDGDTTSFDVNWSASASEATTWTFSGKENEAGVIYFSNGLKSSVVYDEDGNATTTVITEEGQGSVEVLEDGTMIWTEDGEEHEFVRD